MGAMERRVARILIVVEFTTTEGAPACAKMGFCPNIPSFAQNFAAKNQNLRRRKINT